MIDLRDYFKFSIRVKDFNDILSQQDFSLLKNLRTLTLHPGSGMNNELDSLVATFRTRKVNAKAILAYKKSELVGWALLSKEPSNYYFSRQTGFTTSEGYLFEVYVTWAHRRTGIGSQLIAAGRRHAKKEKLCIIPWDTTSTEFYNNFKHYNHKVL